jgi:hypothetical protein
MATSFRAGDPAFYLNLANTGGLIDRGNGLPLFITFLNAAVYLPLPVEVSDGVRCGFMIALLGIATVMLTFRAGLVATGSSASAFVAGVAILFSGLIWQSTAWIMPHISLAFVGAVVLNLLLAAGRTGSPSTIFQLGLACGLGFGLMPNTLLLLPAVAMVLWLEGERRSRRDRLVRLGIGTSVGIVINVLLIVIHEGIVSTVSTASGQGMSISDATWFYLRGGAQTSWFLHNVTLGHFVSGLLRLPLELAAEFEIVGSALAVVGLVVGLRERPAFHTSLVIAFALVALWVGTYPGDTRVLHGSTAYPIAALWLALGAARVLSFLGSFDRVRRVESLHPRLAAVTLGVGLCLALVTGIVGGKLVYRDALCARGSWLVEGFCSERVPEPAGDRYLVRARDAVMAVPEGALMLGAAWDATHQMNYLIRVHEERADLHGAFDLTKLDVSAFETLVEPYWSEGTPVYLFGEWEDVELWSPELLAHFDSRRRGAFLFELVDSDQVACP